jgi:hypothetical protein
MISHGGGAGKYRKIVAAKSFPQPRITWKVSAMDSQWYGNRWTGKPAVKIFFSEILLKYRRKWWC